MSGHSGDNHFCSICLSEIYDISINMVTRCNHSFHINCLSSWTKIKDTCPYCRKNLISSHRLIALVSENIYSYANLSEETIKLPISKFVYNSDTGTCNLVPNYEYPELEVYSVISFNLSVLRDTGSTAWRIIQTLMPYYNDNSDSKQWLHIKKEPDNKTTFIIITETEYNPGIFLIKDIFKDVWSHMARIEKI